MADRELTLRAVASGAAVGAVLALGNLYLGLKTGFWDAGNITAAVIGFALAAPAAEHNVMQATASSTSSMPSTIGFLGVVPALALLGMRPGPVTLVAWGLVLGVAGVLVAVALRTLLIERENLPFPTGRAAAEVIGTAHAAIRRQARMLVGGAAGGAVVAWLRDGLPRVVPATLPAGATLAVALSPMILAVGVLIGARTGLDLLLGAVAARLLGHADDWNVWPGVGLVMGGGLTGLALEWRNVLSLGGTLRALGGRRSGLVAAATGVAIVLVEVVGFQIPLATAVLSVLVAGPLIGVFCRAFGQTDIAHLAALGQAQQAVLAAATPGAAASNILASGVAAGGGAQSTALLTSFKIARIVGGRPGPVIGAQLAGVVIGTAVAVPAYVLLDRAYTVGSAALPVPFAQGFRAMGVVAEQGFSALPAGAVTAAGLAFALGVALTLLARTPLRVLAPSPLAAGLAFLVPFPYVGTIFLGGVVGRLLARRVPDLPSAAAGAIAGESVMGVIIALLLVLGVLPPP